MTFPGVHPINGVMFCVLCIGIMLLLSIPQLIALHYIYFGKPTKTRHEPWGAVAMLPDMEKLDTQIQAQGFRPLGIEKAYFPPTRTWADTWVYANEEGTIWIEAVQLGPDDPAMAQYGSLFHNDAMIHTYIPHGETIDTARYHVRFAAKDVDAAYQYHMQILKEWRSVHGDLYKVETLDDLPHCNQIYYEQHRATNLRPMALSTLFVVFIIFVVILMFMGDAILLLVSESANSLFINVTFCAAFALGFSTIFMPEWTNKYRYRSANSIDRKSKPKNDFADESSF